jgi:hypothetical protein
MEQGLREWMLINSFYYGLNNNSMFFLNKESRIPFINNKPYDVITIIDQMLVETNITKRLDKVKSLSLYINEEINMMKNKRV